MKHLLIAIFLFAFHFSSEASPTKTQISNQIAKVIRFEQLPFLQANEEIQVDVEFLLTSKGEILILGVESTNEEASRYVQEKLNHRKIGIIPENLLLPYSVKITLKQAA